jgi:hypothetical protein
MARENGIGVDGGIVWLVVCRERELGSMVLPELFKSWDNVLPYCLHLHVGTDIVSNTFSNAHTVKPSTKRLRLLRNRPV